MQAWLDFGLLEPVLDLHFSAVDSDDLPNVLSEFSPGTIDSSPDVSSQLFPVDPEQYLGGEIVDTVSRSSFDEMLQGPPTTPWDIACPEDVGEHIVQDIVQPMIMLDPLRITTVTSRSESPRQVPRPLEAPSRPLPPAPRPFGCRQCPARFVGSRQLSDHERNEHKKYCCCNKEYKHYKNFWQHRQAKHLGVRHKCNAEFCDYSADNKWNLKRHKANKHGK